jgi:uncharacterized phiE125 gp8 family phage protein
MLIVTTPAENFDLTTIEAVKAEISTSSNALLATMITQASQAIASYCSRVFARETVQETLRPARCAGWINLERWPVASIASITENGTALVSADYELDASTGQLLRLRNDQQCYWPTGKVIIAYAAGYEDDEIPEPLQRAAIETVKAWWNAKDRDRTIRDVQYSDQSSISYQVGNGALPPIVTDLLAPYRNFRIT